MQTEKVQIRWKRFLRNPVYKCKAKKNAAAHFRGVFYYAKSKLAPNHFIDHTRIGLNEFDDL